MRTCRFITMSARGFTLIELITVLVILGFVAAIGSNFIVSTVNSYDRVQSRSKLINRGRVVVEKMTRRIRVAAPNSIRVSSSGNCIEFLSVVAGVSYLGEVPDSNNGLATVTSIATAPFALGSGSANHVVIGALDNTEIYSSSSPGGRVDAGTFGPGTSFSAIPLATSHRFNRNSLSKRVYVTDDPQRYCLSGSTLVRYTNYALITSGLDDSDPGGDTDLMAEDVSTDTQVFLLSQGVEEINTAVEMRLVFSSRLEQVALNQKVLVRNVP